MIYRWRGAGPWEALGGGLPEPLDAMPYALACLPGWLFAGLGDGRLYVSNDGGDGWRPMALRGDRLAHVRALACLD